MSQQFSPDIYLERLWSRHRGRTFTTLCGDGFGDNGKGCIEAALMPFFEANVRVAGAANTGRTREIVLPDNSKKLVSFHLLPTGWVDNKISIIGDWVLIELERLAKEIEDIKKAIGEPTAPLYISKRCPLHLPYSGLLELWIEQVKGDGRATGSTRRGVSPMLAGIDLRLGPRAGHLLKPDWLKKYVTEFYETFEPIFSQMSKQCDVRVGDISPGRVVEKLLADAEPIRAYLADTDPVLQDLTDGNVPTLFGLTQGYGLHFRGTYPFNSATHSIAQSAGYCSGLPMSAFGPIIMTTKLFPTRVGNGPFPTGLWNRAEALNFPKKRPELFSDSTAFSPYQREGFLRKFRELCNGRGEKGWSVVGPMREVLAEYIQVLGNELGASTGRGRDVGLPDLQFTAAACKANGVDSLFLTRVDLISGLKIKLPVGIGYILNGEPVAPFVLPVSAEELEQTKVEYEEVPLDLRKVDLGDISNEENLPDDFMQLIQLYERRTGAPVSLSTSAGLTGKIFRL